MMDDKLARDVISLWQSEMTACAADRELREIFAALFALWARTSAIAFRHDPAGGAGAAQPARAAAPAAAPNAGLDEIERLGRRIDELERRLAGFSERQAE